MGVVTSQLGRHQQAAEYLGRAIAVNAHVASFHSNLGLVRQSLGQLAAAVASYERALELQPNFPEAQHNLGNALREQGRFSEAVAWYRRSLELRPDSVETLNSLGTAWTLQGRLDEAVACYQRALQAKPEFVEARRNLAGVLRARGSLDEAAACYGDLLQRMPDSAVFHRSLGHVRREQGKPVEAAACFQRAVELSADDPDAHHDLGVALLTLGRFPESIDCFQRARQLKPEFGEACNNQGVACRELGRLDEAVHCFCSALDLNPNFAEVLNNLGLARKDMGQWEEAVACYQKAIALRPQFVQAHHNLGNILKSLRRLDESADAYARALELDPHYADAHVSRSTLRLLTGDFAQGWPEYEWRWKRSNIAPAAFTQPRWDGTPLAGRTILLHAEQGLGDTFQFVRYASLVRQRGGRIVLKCQRPLLRILSHCGDIERLMDEVSPELAFDVHAPLISLPGIFETTASTIPADVPYLFSDPDLIARWREELSGVTGFRIGIVWQGNPDYRGDRSRSLPLSWFEPLAKRAHVRLLSLQQGTGVEQLRDVADRFPVVDLGNRLDGESGAFMDTAAVMRNLDLVIAVDTAAAHLAGGLGVPVWVVLSFASDWRWGLEGRDCPWYPTARLFREKRRDDKEGVLAELAAALDERLAVA